MAVSLEDYLKDSKTVQAARRKYTAARADLLTAQRAIQGFPPNGSEALRALVDRRLEEAQTAVDAAEKAVNEEESIQTRYYNTNVNTIQAKADAKESKSDQNRLADAYAMRQRLISANQPTTAIDRSIQQINDKINKVGKYAPKAPSAPGTPGAKAEDGGVAYRDYAKELSTVGQAIAAMDDAARLALSQGLKAAGYNVPVSGIYSDALINTYTQAIVDNQVRSTNFQREIPFLEFLDLKKIEFSQSGGAGGGVQQYRTISNETQAAATIGSVISNLLNREATAAEVKSLTKILNDAEQKNPGQTVDGKTTGGLDRVQFLVDLIKTGVYSDKKLGKSPVLASLAGELKTKRADKRTLDGEDLMKTANSNGYALTPAQIESYTKQIQKGTDIDIIKRNIRNAAALGMPEKIQRIRASLTQ